MSQIISFPIVLIHFEPYKRGQPLYKGQNSYISIGPNVQHNLHDTSEDISLSSDSSYNA
jgi:hypothetical protein